MRLVVPVVQGPRPDRYDYDTGLLTIGPGQSVTASWRIAAI